MMRFQLLALLVLACVAGCRDAVTAPLSGLPVTVQRTAAPEGPPPAATISTAQDTLVARSIVDGSGCLDYSADAGISAGRVVITISTTSSNRVCTQELSSALITVKVLDIPRGSYVAVL